MLPFPLFFLAALAASALAQDDPQEKGGSAPYKICPTKEYSKPYCCTHLIWGMGIGCRARPEEYKSLRDFQNDCYMAYVERQAACCGGKGFSTNYLCTNPTTPVDSPTSSTPRDPGRWGGYGYSQHSDGLS